MKFIDNDLERLNLSQTEDILKLIAFLRGDILSTSGPDWEAYLEKSRRDLPLLGKIVNPEEKLDYSQLNEILLTIDKNRISKGFFLYFLVPEEVLKKFSSSERHHKRIEITWEDFRKGVIKYRGMAMLRYGNFRYAHKTLRDLSVEKIKQKLGSFARTKKELKKSFESRPNKIVDIEEINELDTWMVGYLSGQIAREDAQKLYAAEFKLNPKKYEQNITNSDLEKAETTQDKIKKTAEDMDEQLLGQWTQSMDQLLKSNRDLQTKRRLIIDRAIRNLDIYLTWDYLDVYVATSMRQPWEYQEVYSFVQETLKNKSLENLKLRYFDPTQCYTDDRLDKGFVESLILKRAKLTVYQVQESDTLGKDSELAATLAQGKPVIAYVPKIDESELEVYAKKLKERPLEYFYTRFFSVHSENLYHNDETARILEEKLGAAASREVESVFLKQLADYFQDPHLRIGDPCEVKFKSDTANKFGDICLYMAIMESQSYDKRARLLKEQHPLAMQVNLTSGVANGVLVARSYTACATLIKQMLTNDLKFDIVCRGKPEKRPISDGDSMTELREQSTQCPYRAVTGHKKITNSFWNFYLREESNG